MPRFPRCPNCCDRCHKLCTDQKTQVEALAGPGDKPREGWGPRASGCALRAITQKGFLRCILVLEAFRSFLKSGVAQVAAACTEAGAASASIYPTDLTDAKAIDALCEKLLADHEMIDILVHTLRYA